MVLGGGVAKEHRNIKHALSSTAFTMDKHVDPNSQTELVGHSIVRPLLALHFSKIRSQDELLSYTALCTIYLWCKNKYCKLPQYVLQALTLPYSNGQFGQILSTYGQQAMVSYQHIVMAVCLKINLT